MAKMAKKIVHLDIPIAMLNYQKDWIEVNMGGPRAWNDHFLHF